MLQSTSRYLLHMHKFMLTVNTRIRRAAQKALCSVSVTDRRALAALLQRRMWPVMNTFAGPGLGICHCWPSQSARAGDD